MYDGDASAPLSNGPQAKEKGKENEFRSSLELARDFYQRGREAESECVEALYNLGLAHRLLGDLELAKEALEKFVQLVPGSLEARYQLALVYARASGGWPLLTRPRLDDVGKAQEAMRQLKHIADEMPSDPSVHTRYGMLLSREDEESEAFHFHSEVRGGRGSAVTRRRRTATSPWTWTSSPGWVHTTSSRRCTRRR